jgi:hypothetical protein
LLVEWLLLIGVTTVVMESTGMYWVPPPLPAMLSALSDRFPRGLTKTDAIALRPRAAG